MTLDRHDLKLLSKIGAQGFDFVRPGSQENRAFDLFEEGLLERRAKVYSMKAGGRSQTIRWAYRRTDAGSEAITEK